MKKLISFYFIILISTTVSASDVNLNIDSFEDYAAYIKAITSISKKKQCNKSNDLTFSEEVKNFNVNDDLLISKYLLLNKYDCNVLDEIFKIFTSHESTVLMKYPVVKKDYVKILSVDKNTAAHNVMTGNVKKGDWVICYGLSVDGVPLAKKTALVKSKYTVVNIHSTKYHNKIVQYECEIEK